jgi:hypothetical protein
VGTGDALNGGFVVPRAGKAYDARGEFRALSRADCLSRISSDRTRVAVPLLDLLATSVPRGNIACARVSFLTSYNIGVCVDGEYTTAYSGHQFADSDCRGCD